MDNQTRHWTKQWRPGRMMWYGTKYVTNIRILNIYRIKIHLGYLKPRAHPMVFKNDHAYLFIALAVFSCSTNVGKQVFERNSSVTTCQCVTILYQETGDQVGYIGPLMTSGIRRQRTKQILSLSRWEKENTKIRVIQSGNQWVMLFVEMIDISPDIKVDFSKLMMPATTTISLHFGLKLHNHWWRIHPGPH